MIIVIDGLSGSGKSSTAKAVAEKLGIQYLDSGALYRVVTCIWLELNKDTETFIDILPTKDIGSNTRIINSLYM
jgi:CMP/dCMP kinase